MEAIIWQCVAHILKRSKFVFSTISAINHGSWKLGCLIWNVQMWSGFFFSFFHWRKREGEGSRQERNELKCRSRSLGNHKFQLKYWFLFQLTFRKHINCAQDFSWPIQEISRRCSVQSDCCVYENEYRT